MTVNHLKPAGRQIVCTLIIDNDTIHVRSYNSLGGLDKHLTHAEQ